jgi:predicted Rossmann fold flavoprotein
MKIAVIGGGAAGFFGAIAAAAKNDVTMFEKSGKLLSKVLVSGGGRCNVTHDCNSLESLLQHYPRGHKELRHVLKNFMPADTVEWFGVRHVAIKSEKDGRMFPVTNKSETIANALLSAADEANLRIRLNAGVTSISPVEEGFHLVINGKEAHFDRVLVATGGAVKATHLDWAAALGHTIIPPVPSLFTFNIQDKKLHELSGISVPEAQVRIMGTNFMQEGPVLITHWGLSGPAVLRLSAWGARVLNEKDYDFDIQVNWLSSMREDECLAALKQFRDLNARKHVSGFNPFSLPARLWDYLLQKSEITLQLQWAALSKKHLNSLSLSLTQCTFHVGGKSTFKEEFVTAGGISLRDVDMRTMQSRICPGLYFAGEVLDVDGITGGFNFQAAWATAYAAGNHIAS